MCMFSEIYSVDSNILQATGRRKTELQTIENTVAVLIFSTLDVAVVPFANLPGRVPGCWNRINGDPDDWNGVQGSNRPQEYKL